MDLQALYSVVSQYLLAFIAAGGGLVVIVYGAFRLFSEKWLESKFAERLQTLKAQQEQSIRYVQSTIDREIHRAKKLYDSEFTALSECWGLLRKAYDLSAQTIASFTVQVEHMTDEELERHLVKRGMDESDRMVLIRKTGKDRQDAYYRWSEWRRYMEVDQCRRDFRTHLDANSIFFADGFSSKFRVLEDLVSASNIEFEFRIRYYGSETRSAGDYAETTKLRTVGEPLMKELEEMVRQRLWSVATDGRGSDALASTELPQSRPR